MRRLLSLLCLSIGLAQAATVAGPPLPAPYELQDTRIRGNHQFILAAFVERGTAQGYSLLLARDSRSGQTLWKQNLGWKFGFADGWKDPKTVALPHLEGRYTHLYVFRVRDGKRVIASRYIEATPTSAP